MIFFQDKNIEEQFTEIISSIRPLMNGVAAHKMCEFGVFYEKALGVSIIHLRAMAKKYKKNHALSLMLWGEKSREAMILATLLDNPKETNKEQVYEWIKRFNNQEIIEQACMNLFSHLDFAEELVDDFLNSDEHFIKLTAIILTARLAFNKKIKTTNINRYTNLIVNLIKHENRQIAKSASNSLIHLCKGSEKRKFECIEKLKSFSSERNQFIIEDTIELLKY